MRRRVLGYTCAFTPMDLFRSPLFAATVTYRTIGGSVPAEQRMMARVPRGGRVPRPFRPTIHPAFVRIRNRASDLTEPGRQWSGSLAGTQPKHGMRSKLVSVCWCFHSFTDFKR